MDKTPASGLRCRCGLSRTTPTARRGGSASGFGRRTRREFPDRLHRRGIASSKGLATYLVDLLLQLRDSRAGHCSASSLAPLQSVARFQPLKVEQPFAQEVALAKVSVDPPPMKWSTASDGFCPQEDHYA